MRVGTRQRTHAKAPGERPRRADRERGTSPLELVLLMPFITTAFLILVGLGYVLEAKQHGLVNARLRCTDYVTRKTNVLGTHPAPYLASFGFEQWEATVTNEDPPAFVPFLSAFDSTGKASCLATSTPDRGIVPKLYPAMPPATVSYTIPSSTSTCKELGGSSYLTYILNQGGVGSILGTDSQDCCETYAP